MPTKYNVFTNNLDLVESIDDLIVGPSSATADAIVIFDGTTGVLVKDSTVLISTDGTLAGDSDSAVPTEKAVKTYVDALPVAAMPDAIIQWSAQALASLETAFAPLETITTTAIKQFVRAYNYNVIEYNNGKFEVPQNFKTTGTVTFSLKWFARLVPAGSENVIWQFEHAKAASGTDLDTISYTAIVASASGTGTTQNAEIRKTWTESAATLGWLAGETIYVRWSRKATDALDTFDTQADDNDDALLVNAAILMEQA